MACFSGSAACIKKAGDISIEWNMLFADVVSKMTELAPADSMTASQDGSMVTFTRGDETVTVFCEQTGGTAWVTVSGRRERLGHLSVSPDGDFLAVSKVSPGSAQVDITIVRVTSGEEGSLRFRADQPVSAMSLVFEAVVSALWA
jgi:hypothetical protein